MRKTFLVLVFTAVIAFSGCTGESNRQQATGTANFRAINAIPTSPTFAFLIEERAAGTVEFKNTSGQSTFDDLDYIFNFEVILAGDLTRTRVASTLIETERDNDYTFLLSGPIDAPTVTVWQQESRIWDGTETVFRANFAHSAATVGSVDVYFQAPGVAPALGQEAGTLSFTEFLPAIEYPVADYVTILTTAGDPGDILFTSGTIAPVAQSAFTISVFDTDANDVGPVSVRAFSNVGAASTVADENFSPTIRFIQATPNLATSDIYIDEMLTDQILADHAYKDVTGDIPIAAGTYPITYTAAGNVGAILHEDSATIFQNTHNQFYVVGEVDGLISFQRIPDRRSVETQARFSFMHAANNHESVDLYIVPTGESIDGVFPRLFDLNVGTAPAVLNLQSGDFDLYLTTSTEKTVITGPITLSLALGDVVDYVSYDNVDPAIADIVAIPLPVGTTSGP